MARNTVRVVIDADAKGFERGFKSAAGVAKIAAGNIIADLAVRALGAVKDFVGDSITAFSDLEQAVGGTEAVFGDAGKVIDEFAKTSAESMGLSESEFRRAATSLGGQLKRLTGDVDFAAERSVELTRVAADLAATYGGTTAQAVTALGAAFRGEADPAERFNLDLKIGRVNAKAVELGLAATTGQVDDYAKAQALLALVTEQSADAQGRFALEADTTAGKQQRLNAALEDQKAQLGEAIIPLYLELLGVLKDLLPIVADVAYQIGRITGAFTPGEAAAKAYNAELGKTPETLEEVIALADEFAGSEFGLLDRTLQGTKFNIMLEDMEGLFADISSGPLKDFREALDEGTTGLNLTADQTEVLATAVNRELARRLTDAEQLMRNKYNPTLEDVADATEGVEQATDDTTSALQRYEDEVRSQTDPLYALVSANEKLEDATAAVTEAANEHGDQSPEYVDALMAQAQAFEDVKAAQLKVAEQSGLTREGFESHLRAMGIFTSEQIAKILADFDRVNAFQFSAKRINVSYTGVKSSQQPVNFHSGGVVPGPRGADVPIIAQAGETIIPAGHTVGMNGNGHARELHLLSDGSKMSSDELVASLLQWQRRNGPLPFTT